jgi:hypothetical protein
MSQPEDETTGISMNRIGGPWGNHPRIVMFHILPHPDGYFRALACALVLSLTALLLLPTTVLAQDAPAEDAAPEYAVPEDVAPEDAAPEEVAPEDIPPEEIAPEEAAPEDVAPEEAEPEEAEPEEATPEEATPEEATPEDAAAEDVDWDTASEAKKPWSVSAPCENYQHPYEADLCQQWRAAEAAEATARRSRLLMFIGAIATLLLLLMFVPLLMAVRAARRAAFVAAPVPVNDRTRREELRAYVDVDKLEFIETPESEGVLKVKVVLRNTGQTPAFNVKSAAEVGLRDMSDEDLLPVMRLPERSSLDSARPRLGRDATATDFVSCDSTPALADRVMGGDATILVWGVVEYLDVFDRTHKTAFQYLCNAETLDTGQVFKPMVRGDEDG